MIQEYALDPELLATAFHNDARFFKEAFGPNSIRFISCFPKRWREDLLSAFNRSAFKNDVIAKRAVLNFADRLLEKCIKRNHGPLAPGSWLNKAEQENTNSPFYAIIAESNPNGNDSVIQWSDVPDNPRWDAPHASHPRRIVSALAAAVEPLLVRAKEIIFVDPYFDIVVDEYKPMFEAYFNCIARNIVTDKPKVTIITALRRVQERGVREPSRENVCAFKRDCEELLPGMIPSGCTVTIAVLKEIQYGQRLHNRYILTKDVAIQFGASLGCVHGNANSCEDITVYAYGKGEGPWELYNLQRQPSAFENVITPFEIEVSSGVHAPR